MIQNQDEFIKVGRLFEPYKGIRDYFGRIIKDEGFASLWSGNTVNTVRRRMMMTSGEAQELNGLFLTKSLFKRAAANTLNYVIPEYIILGRNEDMEEVVELLLKHVSDNEELLHVYSIDDYSIVDYECMV